MSEAIELLKSVLGQQFTYKVDYITDPDDNQAMTWIQIGGVPRDKIMETEELALKTLHERLFHMPVVVSATSEEE